VEAGVVLRGVGVVELEEAVGSGKFRTHLERHGHSLPESPLLSTSLKSDTCMSIIQGPLYESFRVIGNQRGRPAAIAQAELLDRFEEWRENIRLDRYRRRPVRFEAITAIAFKLLFRVLFLSGNQPR